MARADSVESATDALLSGPDAEPSVGCSRRCEPVDCVYGARCGNASRPYEIISPIGKGGMGEVYRARDTKLDRDVAIKVLPEEVTADEERVARFEREAKVLASLNHPNIASIHGFESGGLVLELVEGPTRSKKTAP